VSSPERRLERFLRQQIPGATTVTVDAYEPIAGGFSRVTARCRAVIDGTERWLVTRADPPPGQAAVDTDRAQEWELWSWLSGNGSGFVPKALYFDADGSSLGAKTIVMEMVQGTSLMAAATEPSDRLPLADALSDLAAAIHGTDLASLPAAIPRPAAWKDYIDSRIELWRQFAQAEHDPFAWFVVGWLEDNHPAEVPLRLIHGEFQSTNVLVEDGTGRLLAVDWEFSRIGDPREDIAWCAWIEQIQPPPLATLDLGRFCGRYAERSGLAADLVGPATLTYFGVLTGIQVCNLAFPALHAFTAGVNRSIVTAYALGFVATLHEAWMASVGGGARQMTAPTRDN
jgi:aminoglycoside phosphotransferase (APT) family kinase protein